jgi:transposase
LRARRPAAAGIQYVRDDRPFCGTAPPAAGYFYSPDRGGEHPAAHLANFRGFL